MTHRPCLTAGFYNIGLFEPMEAPARGEQSRSDVGAVSNPDYVKILVKPNQTRFRIGDYLNFRVQMNQPSYLVILNEGAGGNTSPINRQAIAELDSGQTLGDDEAKFLLQGPVGGESYEAYWFKDKRPVQELFNALEEEDVPQTIPTKPEEDQIYRAPQKRFHQAFELFLKRLRASGYKSTIAHSTAFITVDAASAKPNNFN